VPLHVSSTCAHHHEIKIAVHSLWYHHTYRWPSRAQVERGFSQPVHTYRCDDTRGCVMQFWLPDDEHMCSKHVEARNKLIVKQTFCASIWLITEIKIHTSSFEQLVSVMSAQYYAIRLHNKIGFKPFRNKINLNFKLMVPCICAFTLKSNYFTQKYFFLSSQRIHCDSIWKTNRLTLYGEIKFVFIIIVRKLLRV